MRVRRAGPGDVEGMLAVKRALALAPDAREAPRGGFLLGATREGYLRFVEHALAWVLEGAEGVAGFAILVPDPLLRASDLWARREGIRWSGEGAEMRLEEERVCYFEQLAVLPAARLHAGTLAMAALRGARETGHAHLFATVVAQPVRNTASLPLLRAIGARRVGSLDEEYEGVGRIVSDLWHAGLRSLPPSRARRRAERMLG